jgi:hypothetical protein
LRPTFGDEFLDLAVGDRVVRFLSLVPLSREEMEFKLANGFWALWERLEAGASTNCWT